MQYWYSSCPLFNLNKQLFLPSIIEVNNVVLIKLKFAQRLIRFTKYTIRSMLLIIFCELKIGSGKNGMLIINHFFDQDIRALRLANHNHFFFVVINHMIFQPIREMYPVSVRRAEVAYNDPAFKLNRFFARIYSRIILFILRKKYRINCIVTPSDFFYWLREFIVLAKEKSIPTVVLDKEGTISPHSYKHHSLNVREKCPFISDRIIVWSARQRQFWLRAGVDEERIKVIGQPRSDLLYLLEKGNLNIFPDNSKPLVVFFSYALSAYIPTANLKEDKLSWQRLRQESHSVISRFASTRPEINFVIKCHPQQADISDIEFDFRHLSNAKVLSGAILTNELLINASLVIGFQTTALIEAVCLEKPVIYTFWSDAVIELENEILPFHKFDIFFQASSPNNFKKLLKEFCDNDFNLPKSTESDKQLIQEYLNNPDGKVSIRVLEFIEQCL